MKTDSFPVSTKIQVLAPVLALLLYVPVQVLGASVLEFGALPELQILGKEDPLFVQIGAEVAGYYKDIAKGNLSRQVFLVRYKVKKGDTFFGIASRLGLTASSLASLNRLQGSHLREGMYLIIPSIPGIFVYQRNPGTLEQEIALRLKNNVGIPLQVMNKDILEDILFYPNTDFTPEERRKFLVRPIINPIPGGRISSGFGNRRNPFGTNITFHAGVDLVEDLGTPVLACADGVIRDAGYEPIYGNYIVIDHGGGWRSFYAHLQGIKVKTGQSVFQGREIATLGNSGRTTGAHLHFELYLNGSVKDPSLVISFQ